MEVNVEVNAEYIKSCVRTIPDWPEKGVQFRDITPLFQIPVVRRAIIHMFVERYLDQRIDVIAGIDARGFLPGIVVAHELNVPFVLIRKKGKLPSRTLSREYELEYGKAVMEIHTDACQKGDRVVLFDDLIATGGTMLAGIELLRDLGGEVLEAAAIIDLEDLKGAEKIQASGVPTFTICEFGGH